MGGGLMELVAHGVSDLYLIGNPQTTFFKIVYRRYTNFSIESIRQTFEGDIDFGKTVVCKIGRNGDLLHRLMIEVDLPQITATNNNTISWVNSIGHAIIREVEIQIGESTIDKHYGEWLEIWSELSLDSSQKDNYYNMISKYDSFTTETGPITVFIPLQFWFCRNIGLSLPLVALQYHDVKIIVKFRNFSEMWTWGPNNNYIASKSGDIITTTSGAEFDSTDIGKLVYWEDGTYDEITGLVSGFPRKVEVNNSSTKTSQTIYTKPNDTPSQTFKISDARIYGDFIFLDQDERKKFAQSTHSYLIDQVQYSGNTSFLKGGSELNINLDFNLNVKELIWVSQLTRYIEDNDHFNFSDTVNPLATKNDPINMVKIAFNGQDRIEERKGKYFRLVQPYYHHTRGPSSHIYTYSFSIKPEDSSQPNGAANFSRIDTKEIRLTFKSGLTDSNVRVYGLNYNLLLIRSGMGSLLYSD
jgi:hypothetical protein